MVAPLLFLTTALPMAAADATRVVKAAMEKRMVNVLVGMVFGG